jgi:SAM-dependent methyltransferase
MRKVDRKFYSDNPAYARSLAEIEAAAYAKYVDALARAGGRDRILDAGCGIGTAVSLLLGRGADAYGCDISSDFVNSAAQTNGPRFALINEDGSFSYEDASFRAAGSLNVLEHVEQPSRFLDEVCRVIMPGGTLVLATPNMLSLSWPRPRQGIKNRWRIRWLNLGLIASRGFAQARSDDGEFIVVDAELDMTEYEPDFDAICLTNYFDIRRALRRRGFRVTSYSATQRVHPGLAGRVIDVIFASPLGWALGAVFVVATKNIV